MFVVIRKFLGSDFGVSQIYANKHTIFNGSLFLFVKLQLLVVTIKL